METAIICVTAFIAAILTFFSGFGLGTILTPVFMIFFPVELAIGLTAVVHFLNNVFKAALVGKNANRDVVIRFGIPAIIAAFAGSWILLHIPDFKPLLTYQLAGHTFEIFPVKLLISLLLMFFALMDLLPYFNKLQFGKDKLMIGGAISGFFGGLSGNQGALRSAFLVKAGLTKEGFIGTAVIVSLLVDFTRLSVYATGGFDEGISDHLTIVIAATLSAVAGVFIGNKLLKKVTFRFLQVSVATMLLLLSIALGAGIL